MYLWLILIISVISLLAIDLGILHRKVSHISFYEALAQSAFWITLGLGFSMVVYFAYEHAAFGEQFNPQQLDGKQALLQYLTAYIVEKSLSLDNLFVIALIFQSMQIPTHLQHRVLLWGIIGAIIMRTLIILLGITLLNQVDWIIYLFGALLIFSAVKLLANQHKPYTAHDNAFVNWLMRHLPVTEKMHNGKFMVRIDGRRFFTPLFVAMLLIETADLMFAVDSIPAVIAISRDPFIVLSSNIFALLGLRALYLVLATAIEHLRYLRLGLIFILLFIGSKMLLTNTYHIDTLVSLYVISGILITAIAASLLTSDRRDLLATSPLTHNASKLYELTYAGMKRIVILVIGISVIIIGIIMIFTPGPAIIVIPAGLAILATEFVWARILLKRFKHKFVHYSKETKSFFTRRNDKAKQDIKKDAE